MNYLKSLLGLLFVIAIMACQLFAPAVASKSYSLENITHGFISIAASVSEPGTYAMLLAGFCVMVGISRRRKPTDSL